MSTTNMSTTSEYFETSYQISSPQVEYIGPFLLGKSLGKGHTGSVRMGTHRLTNFVVAIKIIRKTFLDENPECWMKIKREIAVLKLMDHTNVLQLFDVFETSDTIYLVLEHVKGGELFDYIIQCGHLKEKESLNYLGQIVLGLEHCHSHWVCHRDLKPENILLDSDMNIKIIDFGFAQVTHRWNSELLTTACGSLHYTAPEVLLGETSYDGCKSDVWSCGVILFAMVTGDLPFVDSNIVRLLHLVVAGVYAIPKFVSPLIADLIRKMLVVDPERRMSMTDVRNHEAFKKRCPELYCNQTTLLSPIIKNATTPIPSSPVPWNNGSDLDVTILESLQSMGWGEVDKLKNMLNDDNLDQYKSKNTSGEPSPRVDRALYLLFLKRKIKRVETLEVLSPKASTSVAFDFQRDNSWKDLRPYRPQKGVPKKTTKNIQICDVWGCTNAIEDDKFCAAHVNHNEEKNDSPNGSLLDEFKMDFSGMDDEIIEEEDDKEDDISPDFLKKDSERKPKMRLDYNATPRFFRSVVPRISTPEKSTHQNSSKTGDGIKSWFGKSWLARGGSPKSATTSTSTSTTTTSTSISTTTSTTSIIVPSSKKTTSNASASSTILNAPKHPTKLITY